MLESMLAYVACPVDSSKNIEPDPAKIPSPRHLSTDHANSPGYTSHNQDHRTFDEVQLCVHREKQRAGATALLCH